MIPESRSGSKPRIDIVKEIVAFIYRNRCVSYDQIRRLYDDLCKSYECSAWSTVLTQLTRAKKRGKLANPAKGVWCSPQ